MLGACSVVCMLNAQVALQGLLRQQVHASCDLMCVMRQLLRTSTRMVQHRKAVQMRAQADERLCRSGWGTGKEVTATWKWSTNMK